MPGQQPGTGGNEQHAGFVAPHLNDVSIIQPGTGHRAQCRRPTIAHKRWVMAARAQR